MTFFFLIGLFALSEVPEYSITCDPSEFQYMMYNWEEEIVIPCTVSHGGTVYGDCTMRIRGDTSRIYEKKSYRVEFPPDQPLMGRTSWNFNAEYLDHSYIRAWLFSRVLEEMGSPSFQISHARLNVNGDYRGLFILVEPVNKSFLTRNGINCEGNLYKAKIDGACANIHDDIDSLWAKMTNESSGMNDLAELIQSIENCPAEEFQAFMDSAFTMYGPDGLLRILAVNSAFANNSTYYHNYYLYNDVLGTGRWMMLPWDTDKVLSENLGISYGGCTNENWYDNPIHSRTLAVPAFRQAFQDSVLAIYDGYLTDSNLGYWADSLQAVLLQAVSEDTFDNTDAAGFQTALLELQTNLEVRRTDLQWQFQYKYFPFRSFRSDTLSTGSLSITWASTADPAGNPAMYTVVVRDSLGPSSDEIMRFEGIQDTVFTVTGIPPGDFWWSVETEKQAGWRRTEGTDRYNPFTVVNPVILSGALGSHTLLTREYSPYYIPYGIFIPADGTLEIQAGVTILMGEDATINCGGLIMAAGTSADSVFIIPENSSSRWRGIRVENGEVIMRHTVISGARGYADSPGTDFAVLSCHSSSITLENTVFRNNWCCVKLDQGTAVVDSCVFIDNRGELFFIQNGQSAAISNSVFQNLYDPVASSMDGIEFHLCDDGQFSVQNCTVTDIDGDCIDMNASTVSITDSRVSSSTDKGLSIGAPTGGSAEGTVVTVENCIVENCPSGIAVKDGASLNGSNIVIRNCQTALHVFEKTAGMGGGYASLSNSVFTQCASDVTVEQGSAMVEWSISDNGPLPGQSNISGNPELDLNCFPLFNSPCIDSGDPSMQDPDGSRRDMGAFFFPTITYGLTVNELMALNDTVIPDDWGRYSDWIELFNGTGYDLDAGVLVFFGSDSSGAEPWSVPRGTMIPAGGFMLFWADGDGWKGGTHLPFRLSGSGDSFSLGRQTPGAGATPLISTIEQIDFQDQTSDVSIGRFPDGGQWQILETPTPGFSNGTLYLLPVTLGWPRPNPCTSGQVTFEAVLAGGNTEIFVYDMAGRRVATLFNGYAYPGSSTFTWNTEKVPSGVYLLFARCASQTPASAKVTVLH